MSPLKKIPKTAVKKICQGIAEQVTFQTNSIAKKNNLPDLSPVLMGMAIAIGITSCEMALTCIEQVRAAGFDTSDLINLDPRFALNIVSVDPESFEGLTPEQAANKMADLMKSSISMMDAMEKKRNVSPKT